MYTVLLFYKYINIENPAQLMLDQKALCEKLNLKGRLIIATEGINVTLEGLSENVDKYINEMKKDLRFSDIHFKVSNGTVNGNAFPKLSVRVRPEIVSTHLGNDDIDPTKITGKYISAEELHQLFNSDQEFYLVDMRNGYEQESGYFKNSINSNFKNFRDLPAIKNRLIDLKSKKIITVCTGGVRCEKASGYLVNNGFSDVSQLYGGIHSYMEKFPGDNWLGKLYVFDQRMLIDFTAGTNKAHPIIGKCNICGSASENYVDCENTKCKRHTIVCKECLKSFNNVEFCSRECFEEKYGK